MARRQIRSVLATVVVGAAIAEPALAQRGGGGAATTADSGSARWDVTLARGKTRDISFTTTEGTWMSADISAEIGRAHV